MPRDGMKINFSITLEKSRFGTKIASCTVLYYTVQFSTSYDERTN